MYVIVMARKVPSIDIDLNMLVKVSGNEKLIV